MLADCPTLSTSREVLYLTTNVGEETGKKG